MKIQIGFYWIRVDGIWTIGYYNEKELWCVFAYWEGERPSHKVNIEIIGERIEPPFKNTFNLGKAISQNENHE
jgi:hypothetical protein